MLSVLSCLRGQAKGQKSRAVCLELPAPGLIEQCKTFFGTRGKSHVLSAIVSPLAASIETRSPQIAVTKFALVTRSPLELNLVKMFAYDFLFKLLLKC